MRAFIRTCCSVIAVAVATASPAFAQQAPASDSASANDEREQEIVVTAQRRSESINRVPMAVQALGSATLDELHIDNVQALASAVPGLSVAPAYSGVPIFTLRGRLMISRPPGPPSTGPYQQKVPARRSELSEPSKVAGPEPS